jgi:hypothetical protein
MCGVIGSICNFERNSDKYLLSDSFPEFVFADAKEKKEPPPKARKKKNGEKNHRKEGVVVVIFAFLVYISRLFMPRCFLVW